MIQIKAFKSEFFRNVFALATGNVITQALSLILIPIWTRLYSPENIAVFELFYRFCMIMIHLFTFKYEMAILKPKKKADALNLMFSAIIISFVLMILLTIAFTIFNKGISAMTGNPQISDWLYIIPATTFFGSVGLVFNFWFNRNKKYRFMAACNITSAATNNAGKISLGFLGFYGGGLQTGLIIGNFMKSLVYLVKFLSREYYLIRFYSFKKSKGLLKTHKNFALFSTPASLLNAFTASLHIFLFSYYYSATEVGFLAVTTRITFLPVSLIAASISPVFYQKISQIENPVLLKKTYLRLAKNLSIVSITFAVLIQFLPSHVMGIIFGHEWTALSHYLKILVWWPAFSFITSSLSFIYIRLDRQKETLIFDISKLMLVFISIAAGFHFFGSIITTLKIYTFAQVFMSISVFLFSIIFLNQNIKKYK